jgi:hypothetical protein
MVRATLNIWVEKWNADSGNGNGTVKGKTKPLIFHGWIRHRKGRERKGGTGQLTSPVDQKKAS